MIITALAVACILLIEPNIQLKAKREVPMLVCTEADSSQPYQYAEPPFTHRRMYHPLVKYIKPAPYSTCKGVACLPYYIYTPGLYTAARRDSLFGDRCIGKDVSY